MAARYIYAGAWQAAEETLIPFGFGIDLIFCLEGFISWLSFVQLSQPRSAGLTGSSQAQIPDGFIGF